MQKTPRSDRRAWNAPLPKRHFKTDSSRTADSEGVCPVVRIVVATRNRHKQREIDALCGASKKWRLLFLDRYPNAPHPRETGKTFDENATLKARAIATYTGLPSISDDSGLEVAALGGKPGVRSARFAGARATDKDNNEKLLRLLKNLPLSRRKACYRCSLALAFPDGKTYLFRGKLSGRIAFLPAGLHGFGYDPLFIVPRYGKTVAELSPALKNKISHRARAFRKLRRFIQKYARG